MFLVHRSLARKCLHFEKASAYDYKFIIMAHVVCITRSVVVVVVVVVVSGTYM